MKPTSDNRKHETIFTIKSVKEKSISARKCLSENVGLELQTHMGFAYLYYAQLKYVVAFFHEDLQS